MDRLFFTAACIFGGLAVAIGAFGAHALESRLTEALLGTFETGVRYHFYHALALMFVVVAIRFWPNSSLPTIAGWLFVVGILIFSGSLYILVLSDIRWLGAVTPIGGAAFIAGWLCLALTPWRG